jgi:acyl-CoA synthetase (NDP forming)
MEKNGKDFDRFFNPQSIAIVGVPKGDYRFGGISFLTRLLESEFKGRIYPINPKTGEILGLKAYPSLSSLPEVPDLVMVSVPAPKVPAVLEECSQIGQRHIHIISAGFRETGTHEGRALEEQIASISRENGLLVIGPNCMGPYCPKSGLTAWGAIPGMKGPLGIISQSGGITQRLTEYMYSLGLGVEKAVSIGNATVLDSTDFLEYFSNEVDIRLIAMYLESVKDGRLFANLLKRITLEKPVVLWKGGQTEVGAKTVSSHTGTMAGEKRIWEALCNQTGMIQVHSMDEWADAILALSLLNPPKGNGVFLIGGGGGNSATASDLCIREGLEVPQLTDKNMVRLRNMVPIAGCIAGNPLDMWRTFHDPEYLSEVLEIGYSDPNISMIIIDRLIPRKAFHLPDLPDRTEETIDLLRSNIHRKPTVFTVDSEGGDPDLARNGAILRARFCRAGIPAYPSLKRAVRALSHLYRYHCYRRSPNRSSSC